MTGPREWRHAEGCDAEITDPWGDNVGRACTCCLSAVRDATAAGHRVVIGPDGALADPAPVGLSQAGYTDEAIGPNEARMIAMNERLVKERDELRAEVDRLRAAATPLSEGEVPDGHTVIDGKLFRLERHGDLNRYGLVRVRPEENPDV